MGETTGTTLGGLLGTILLSVLLVYIPYQLVNMGNLLNTVWGLTGGLAWNKAKEEGSMYGKAAWNENKKKLLAKNPKVADFMENLGKNKAKVQASAESSEVFQEKRLDEAKSAIEEEKIEERFNRMAGWNKDTERFDDLPSFYQALDQKDPDALVIRNFILKKAQTTAESQSPEDIAKNIKKKGEISGLGDIINNQALETLAGDARFGDDHEKALEIREDMDIKNRPMKKEDSLEKYRAKYEQIPDDSYVAPLFPRVGGGSTPDVEDLPDEADGFGGTVSPIVTHPEVSSGTHLAVEKAITSGATFKQAIEIVPELKNTQGAEELYKAWQLNLKDELGYHKTTVRNALEILPTDSKEAREKARLATNYLADPSSAEAAQYVKTITGANVESNSYGVETILKGVRDGAIAKQIITKINPSYNTNTDLVVSMGSAIHQSEKILSKIDEKSISEEKTNIAFSEIEKILNKQYENMGVSRRTDFSSEEERRKIISEFSKIKNNNDYDQRVNFFDNLIK